jgi:hypothetical protein
LSLPYLLDTVTETDVTEYFTGEPKPVGVPSHRHRQSGIGTPRAATGIPAPVAAARRADPLAGRPAVFAAAPFYVAGDHVTGTAAPAVRAPFAPDDQGG